MITSCFALTTYFLHYHNPQFKFRNSISQNLINSVLLFRSKTLQSCSSIDLEHESLFLSKVISIDTKWEILIKFSLSKDKKRQMFFIINSESWCQHLSGKIYSNLVDYTDWEKLCLKITVNSIENQLFVQPSETYDGMNYNHHSVLTALQFVNLMKIVHSFYNNYSN